MSLTFPVSSVDCPPVPDHMIANVTSSSFHVSWSLNSTQNRPFQVRVYRGEELFRTASTRGTSLEVAGLEAGVLYRVQTGHQACGANVTNTLTVRTGKATRLKPTLVSLSF